MTNAQCIRIRHCADSLVILSPLLAEKAGRRKALLFGVTTSLFCLYLLISMRRYPALASPHQATSSAFPAANMAHALQRSAARSGGTLQSARRASRLLVGGLDGAGEWARLTTSYLGHRRRPAPLWCGLRYKALSSALPTPPVWLGKNSTLVREGRHRAGGALPPPSCLHRMTGISQNMLLRIFCDLV